MNEDRARLDLPMGGFRPELEAFPIPVVPDWGRQVKRASKLCRLIDRHLNDEAEERLFREPAEFQPRHLAAEQRIELISDLKAMIGSLSDSGNAR